MKKITFIGAGSFIFTRGLVRDILTYPALCDAHIALMDIDPERLDFIRRAVEKIVEAGGYPARITATLDRAEALKGADGVVITIAQGGIDVVSNDIDIPKKFGVDLNVGDTRGPAGVFRALRTIPIMLDICRDIERYCPEAVVLNYTNPMAMVCRAMQSETKVNVTGLCHSVQGTAEMLARWIGAPKEEITYTCAGINHQAFYLDYKWNGRDAYPFIHEAVTSRPEVYNEEIVRNEMYLHLGYYVTESSGHNSEYVAWFRKRPDLIEKYCNHGTSWNPGVFAYCRDEYAKRESTWKDNIKEMLDEPVNLARGHEYASCIFNATIGDGEMYKFNGNVRNFGLVDNLPWSCSVEVPVLASKNGFEPMHVGALPLQLAAMNNTTAYCEEMAVQGCLAGDPTMIFHSIAYDPLTSAVLSLAEIKQMVGEMFEANRQWLPQFKCCN